MDRIEKIVLLGAGNVSTHLGAALQGTGRRILQVYSRTIGAAEILARKLDTDFTTDLNYIYPGADLYIFSLADNAMEEVLDSFPLKDVFAVHTSGSLPVDILQKAGLQAGVFYPLQTFSKTIEPDFSNIPLCIEAKTEKHQQILYHLASEISRDVRFINSKQRETIHIAAVFACNFTNHLFSIAEEILENKEISFDIMYPLIQETVRKAMQQKPSLVQTGPAVRKDDKIIQKHLKQLSTLPDYQKLYNFISQSITQNSTK
ncbi:MAG: DUF2520 domain-containing protein [Bacteroidetes bacterium]|nr:MAG: DUF2520 domain-containing protein [Bacteroidota bacterium]